MRDRYTLTELRAMLGVSLLTLRRWLRAATITPERDRYDAHKYFVQRADAERLALHHGRVLVELDNSLPITLEAAHREIVQLRQEIQRLHEQLAQKPAHRLPAPSVSNRDDADNDGQTAEATATGRSSRRYYSRTGGEQKTIQKGPPLPAGYVTYQNMAERHSVPTSNVEYALMRAKEPLPSVKGQWFEGAQHIYYALDETGQTAFVQRFWGKVFPGSAARPRFQECDPEQWPECYCHMYAQQMLGD
jgi:hypothetical protein